MIVGVPKEIKQDEYRVAMLPVGLMFAGAGLMVRAAQGPQAHVMADGPVFGAWVSLLARPGMLPVLLFILLLDRKSVV